MAENPFASLVSRPAVDALSAASAHYSKKTVEERKKALENALARQKYAREQREHIAATWWNTYSRVLSADDSKYYADTIKHICGKSAAEMRAFYEAAKICHHMAQEQEAAEAVREAEHKHKKAVSYLEMKKDLKAGLLAQAKLGGSLEGMAAAAHGPRRADGEAVELLDVDEAPAAAGGAGAAPNPFAAGAGVAAPSMFGAPLPGVGKVRCRISPHAASSLANRISPSTACTLQPLLSSSPAVMADEEPEQRFSAPPVPPRDISAMLGGMSLSN